MPIRDEQLYNEEFRRSPAPVWAQLRDEHPLFYDSIGDVWWLTRYADVAAVFADYETYSASTYEESTGQVIGPTLISRDDAGHVVRRKIVAPDLVGNRLATFHDLIAQCARTLIDGFAAAGEVDLVQQFSTHLPVDVISAMLGMTGDGDLFRQWVTDMIMGLAPAPELREQGLASSKAFCEHIAPALVGVEAEDRHDLIAKIARAEVDGFRLDHDEITAFCGLLFIAGGETTDKAIANMWWNLLTRPEQWRLVLDDPQRWDNAFTEMMRHSPPVLNEDRFTTAPVEWYGTEIPTGSRVRVCIGSANRDPSVWADPDTFDLDRADLHQGIELRSGGSNQPGRHGHLGFGLGKHFCVGYQLARTEAVMGSQMIVDRCSDIAIAPGADPQPSVVGRSFYAVESLPLTFTPRS